MKVSHNMGSFEDSRGFVGARRLREAYALASKDLRRAERAVRGCVLEERLPALKAWVKLHKEAVAEAERAIAKYEG
jgi:hypothetical protein